MKIAVFGWYGHDNAGDERIKYCLNKFIMDLGGVSEIKFYDFHDCAMRRDVGRFEDYDLIVFGGGGLIFSDAPYQHFISALKNKIVTLGISVEAHRVSGHIEKYTKVLLEKSDFFLVRDRSSYEKLKKMDVDNKIKLTADLSFLCPYDEIKTSSGNAIGVNILPKPINFKYSTLVRSSFNFFIRCLNRLGLNNLIRVHDFKGLLDDLSASYELKPVPLYSGNISAGVSYQKDDVRFMQQYFSSVPTEFDHRLMDECSAFMCMRFHAAIFAIQKNIPLIAIPYLPKNVELMRELDLEGYLVSADKQEEIPQLLDKVLHNAPEISEKMMKYKHASQNKVQNDLI